MTKVSILDARHGAQYSLGLIFCTILILSLFGCETKEQRSIRISNEERQKSELQARQLEKEAKQKIERQRAEEAERERKRLENIEAEKLARYLANPLRNGAMPYSNCFGSINSCEGNSCSEIKVITPGNSSVLVTIKNRDDKVVRHAMIREGNSYTFHLPNGYYQPFFIYGIGWNPEKSSNTDGGCKLSGGFAQQAAVGKDAFDNIYNTIITYELRLQADGNFSTRPSNLNEAL